MDTVHIARHAVGREQIRPGSVDISSLAPQSIKEQHLHPDLLGRLGTGAVAVIDLGDSPVLTGFSRGYMVQRAARLSMVGFTLSVAGSGSTVASVVRNGSSVGSVTVPAGSSSGRLDFSAEFVAGDVWQMNVTSVGAGAVGLVWFGKFA